MGTYDSVSELSLTVESYSLKRLERETSSDFTRVSTVVELEGDDEFGRGEDVTYETEDHEKLHNWEPDFGFEGEYTLDEFSEKIDTVELFPEEPEGKSSRNYRRWAFESAALDLALKQKETSFADSLDVDYSPVRFVASTRLGDPPTTDRLEELLGANPELEFKLDPTPDWDDELVNEISSVCEVEVLDLKAYYEGTEVDQPPDPDLYRTVFEGFPEAVVEDAAVTEETRPILKKNADRLSWDYPITGIESIEELEFSPNWINIKPSRFGTLESLLDTIDYCNQNEIRMYGGGQFELGVGRGQLHEIASLFYPDSPNDIAPSEYNDPEITADLPSSPITPPNKTEGFGW